MFRGQLCRLPSDCTVKQIFMYRLSHYTKNSHLQRGFIPDIYRILGKCSLIHSPEQFIVTGNFLISTDGRVLYVRNWPSSLGSNTR